MKQLQDRLRSRLANHGWRISRELMQELNGLTHLPAAWWLSSTTPPVGRQVVIEFRIHEYAIDDWYGGAHAWVTAFYVAIRYPATPDSPEYLEPGEERLERNECRQLFRVLEWFRDPTSHSLYFDPWSVDWMPPDDWDAARWAPGTGLEASWDTLATSAEMLQLVMRTLSERKLRLLTCLVCRHLPVSMLEERNRLAVEAAERYAENLVVKRELKKVARMSELAWLAHLEPQLALYEARRQLQKEDPDQLEAVVTSAIREVVGNPFRKRELRHTWLRANGGLVRRLAEAAALEGDFGVLPVLADALEDAGCTEEVLLDHCRQAGEHARGCWAVDLLTEKS